MARTIDDYIFVKAGSEGDPKPALKTLDNGRDGISYAINLGYTVCEGKEDEIARAAFAKVAFPPPAPPTPPTKTARPIALEELTKAGLLKIMKKEKLKARAKMTKADLIRLIRRKGDNDGGD